MFRFKKFSLEQDMCAMKIGTDSVLLGAWADASGAVRFLDVGTGTGILSLMIAQKNQDALIDAIDVDNNAVTQANNNIGLSIYSSRIKVERISFADFCVRSRRCEYDHIISNPPFFEDDTSSPDVRRAVARNVSSLPFEELISGSCCLLKDYGKLTVVIPVSSAFNFISTAARYGLYLTRRTDVADSPSSVFKRSLLEFAKNNICRTVRTNLILRDDDGNKTPEYEKIVDDFYL